MIYLIYGPDSFRSNQYLNYLKDFYHNKNHFYFSFDFADKFETALEPAQLKELFGSITLFSQIKIISLKNLLTAAATLKKEIIEVIEESKVASAKSILLIIYEEGEIKDTKNFTWLKKQAKQVKEFPLLKGKAYLNWIEAEAKKLGFRLTAESLELLSFSFGSETGALYYVLQKLSLLGLPLVDRKTLETYVWLPFNTNIFNFLDYLAAGNFSRAFKLLEEEFAKDDSVTNFLHIFSLIIFEFRSLILIKESQSSSVADIARKTNLKIYPVTKMLPLAKKFSLTQLKNVYQRLVLCDERIKRGLLPPGLALELLLLDLRKILTN